MLQVLDTFGGVRHQGSALLQPQQTFLQPEQSLPATDSRHFCVCKTKLNLTNTVTMKSVIFTGLFLFITSLTLLQCTDSKADEAPATQPTEADLVKQGKYLVGILGCHDCHSPKRMGAQGPEIIPELHLSGYPADRPVGKIVPEAFENGWMLFGSDGTSCAGPWGVSFAANLTSDESGIGSWSYEQFKIALTQGKYKGLDNGRPLLPPMPWFNYTAMKEEDIRAIFQYLKSTPPVRNLVPAPVQ